MPPTKAEVRRLENRYEWLITEGDERDLLPNEGEDLHFMTAIRAEMIDTIKEAQGMQRTLDLMGRRLQLAQEQLEECRKSGTCSVARRIQLEDRLVALMKEQHTVVDGVEVWFRCMSPWLLGLALAGIVTVGALAAFGTFTGLCSTLFANFVPVLEKPADVINASDRVGEAARDLAYEGNEVTKTVLGFIPSAAMALSVGKLLAMTGLVGTGPAGLAVGVAGVGAYKAVGYSDVPLKRAVKRQPPTARDHQLWPLPTYTYHWNSRAMEALGLPGGKTRGIMSRDVRRLFPHDKKLVVRHASGGYDQVDYYRLLCLFKRFRAQGRTAPSWTRDAAPLD